MNFEQLAYTIISAIFAISIHEYAHGFVAYKLGDPTPKAQGRLTLNPLKHLDPIGALMLIIAKVGWAKPVQINPLYFKNRRQAMILVALAGPLANITTAWVVNIISVLLFRLPLKPNFLFSLYLFACISIEINIMLAAFNLIPIPPLDGSKIVANLLPLKMRLKYERISPYAPLILIVGIWTGALSYIISPLYRMLFSLIRGFSL